MAFMDVYTSIVAILLCGWIAGIVAQLMRLPRVVVMIFAGIALMPAVHPTVLSATTMAYAPTATSPVYGPAGAYATQSPASSIRTMALLIALMRGGLSVKLHHLAPRAVPVAVLAFLPYLLEMAVVAAAAPLLLPKYFAGDAPGKPVTGLVLWTAGSVWAPLSPSIVIPNTLIMLDSGYKLATQVVLVGAPLEISTALITEGVMSGVQSALNSGNDPTVTLAHIPVYVVGSVLYGLVFALFFFGYVRARARKEVQDWLGIPKADPSERLCIFVMLFILCYTSSIDDVNVPWLIGFFAAICMAMGVQHLLPEIGDEMALTLKTAWFYAECMLFVLTGCVVRPAIDLGLGLDLFGWFFAVLLLGTLGRMAGDVVVAVFWQLQANLIRGRGSPLRWTPDDWRDVLRRAAFLWVTTIPKATLQGTLGPKLATLFKAGGFTGAANFIAPSSAIAILYAATFGNILTYSAGYAIVKHLEAQEVADLAEFGAKEASGEAAGAAKPVLEQAAAPAELAAPRSRRASAAVVAAVEADVSIRLASASSQEASSSAR
jgi:NhaP-type Na+/H+ or K+/H+ antiporter